jgi:hypothetical protein
MANIGDLIKPGQPAPDMGIYQCSGPGCSTNFRASVQGVPLPPAHHTGASWKLINKSSAGAPNPAQSGTTAPKQPQSQPVKGISPAPGKGAPPTAPKTAPTQPGSKSTPPGSVKS